VATVNLKPNERLKLFILNLGHIYIAEVWARRGRAPALTLREAIEDRAFHLELDALFDEEALPVFAGIGMGKEAEAYRATVIERSSNPFLDRRLSEIFINHEAKKRRRFGGLIELAEASGVGVKQPRLKAALAD
jgi:tagaturonate reductase